MFSCTWIFEEYTYYYYEILKNEVFAREGVNSPSIVGGGMIRPNPAFPAYGSSATRPAAERIAALRFPASRHPDPARAAKFAAPDAQKKSDPAEADTYTRQGGASA